MNPRGLLKIEEIYIMFSDYMESCFLYNGR